MSRTKHSIHPGSLEGAAPAPDSCTEKGMLVNKPFDAYYMIYTEAESKKQVPDEEFERKRIVKENPSEKLAMQHEENIARIH